MKRTWQYWSLAPAFAVALSAASIGVHHAAETRHSMEDQSNGTAVFESISLKEGTMVGRHGTYRRLVLEVRDREGSVGICDMGRMPSGDDITRWRKLIQKARRPLEGQDLLDHDALWDRLRREMKPSELACIDIACWDLHARREGKSLCDLIGRKRDKVLVYASSHFKKSWDDYLQWAKHMATQKPKAVKVFSIRHPQQDWPHHRGKVYPEEHLKLLREVRRILGPDVVLLTDLNFGFTFEESLAFGKAVDADPQIDLAWYEEPCLINLEHYKILTKELKTGVSALDIEMDRDHKVRLEWLAEEALDMCRFDVRANGGITPALRVLDACRKRPGVVFNCHAPREEAWQLMATATEAETGPMERFGSPPPYQEISVEPGCGFNISLDTVKDIERT